MGPGMGPGQPGVGAFGGILMVVMGLIYVGMIVGWVFFIVASWKLMRAHERIAETLRGIAQALRSQPPRQ